MPNGLSKQGHLFARRKPLLHSGHDSDHCRCNGHPRQETAIFSNQGKSSLIGAGTVWYLPSHNTCALYRGDNSRIWSQLAI